MSTRAHWEKSVKRALNLHKDYKEPKGKPILDRIEYSVIHNAKKKAMRRFGNVRKAKRLENDDKNIFHVVALNNNRTSDSLIKALFHNNDNDSGRFTLEIQRLLNTPFKEVSSYAYLTPPQIILANNQLDRFELLLNLCKEYDYTIEDRPDDEGITTFIRTVLTLDEDLAIRFATEHPFNINHQDVDGKTALHYACIFGLKQIIYFLLINGADLSIKDNENKIALFYLQQSEHTTQEIIKKYLEWQDIEPNRAYNAEWNGFYCMTESGAPRYKQSLVWKKTNSTVIKTRAIIARVGESLDHVKSRLENIDHWGCIDRSQTIAGSSDPIFLSKKARLAIVKEMKGLSRISLIDLIMSDRQELREDTQLMTLWKVLEKFLADVAPEREDENHSQKLPFRLQAYRNLKTLFITQIPEGEERRVWKRLKKNLPVKTLKQNGNCFRAKHDKSSLQFFALKNLDRFAEKPQVAERSRIYGM